MITLQIRKHQNPFIRKYSPVQDKLIGEFTSLKELLQTYKALGCGTVEHYMVMIEKGIPPVIITPVTKHFQAVGLTRPGRGPISEDRQPGGWKGGEV